ncbi:MAG: restriction endonuclease subunit S, partial [Methanocorpusculum parvum]|nr:restriction endonuclease subunit S [Methanocorpusculum parvum]
MAVSASEKVLLGDVFNLQMGKTPAREQNEYWNNGDNPWVSIADLSSYDKYVAQTKETISDLG